MRNAHVLGLRAIDGVPQDPAAGSAMGRHAPTAEVADPAGGNAGDEHEISCMNGRDARADGLDHADALVSKNAARAHAGNVTLQDMKVRAANSRSGDANNGIAPLTNRRLWFARPCSLTG